MLFTFSVQFNSDETFCHQFFLFHPIQTNNDEIFRRQVFIYFSLIFYFYLLF